MGGGADALQKAGADQHTLTRGDSAQQRRHGEGHDAREEDAPSPDEVAEPSGEEQQAAEGDEERVDDPGQVGLAEVEVALDRRQRDVHDRDVEDDHQLCEAHDDEGNPAPAVRAGGADWERGKIHAGSQPVEMLIRCVKWRPPPK